MTPTPPSVSRSVSARPSQPESRWLEAALRAFVIPYDPSVARVEADVWESWATNASTEVEQLVLETAVRLARLERTSEAQVPDSLGDLGREMLSSLEAATVAGTTGILEGYIQARRTVLFGLDDLPVGPRSVLLAGKSPKFQGRAVAHRAVLLAAIERHAANVPVWRWLARWYGALDLAQGRAIEDLATFQWGQVAFAWLIRLGSPSRFVHYAWAVVDRIAAASVCYTRRTKDFQTLTLTSLRGTGVEDPARRDLPAPPGIMHSIPLTVPEMWNARLSFRSPDRAPEGVIDLETRFAAFELEINFPDPVWTHMPNGEHALTYILPDTPGQPRRDESVTPRRAPNRRRLPKHRRQFYEESGIQPTNADVVPSAVVNILDDPPRFGSPFLGDVVVRDPRRVLIRRVNALPPL